MSEVKLRPCPRCAKKPFYHVIEGWLDRDPVYIVECLKGCRISARLQTDALHGSKEKVCVMWNTRPLEDDLLKVLEEVKEACLFTDDFGIGVTTDPHISEELFDKILMALSTTKGEKTK